MTFLDIPDGWKYVISSLVGGGIAIFITFLNNRYQLRKDAQNWEKEKLWNGYQKCISNLNLIEALWTDLNAEHGVNYVLKIEESKEIFSLYSEIIPYLHWIVYNHPNHRQKEIQALKEIIELKKENDTHKFNTIRLNFLIQPQALYNIKKELIQLMINDPRFLQNNQ